MLYSGSRPIAMWFSEYAVSIRGDETEGSLLDQIFLSSVFLLALIALAKRRLSWSNVLKDNPWFFLLIFYIGISALWSDYSMSTFKSWIRLVGLIICAMVIMSETEPWQALATVFRRTAYILVPFSVLLIKYFPSYGISYGRWSGGRMPTGVCIHKNELGLLCIVSAFFLIWDLLRKRRFKSIITDKKRTIADIVITMITLYLMKGADTNVYSATAIGSLIVGLCTMIGLSKLRSRSEFINSYFIVVGIIIAIMLVAFNFMEWSPMALWANFLGRNEDLTGRLEIWTEAFKIAPLWSVLGTGFGAFWGQPFTIEAIDQTTGHNGYIEMYIELGIVGILLLAMFLLQFWRRLIVEVKHNFDQGMLGICLFIMSIVYNYGESNFLNVKSILWTALIFMLFALSGKKELKNK